MLEILGDTLVADWCSILLTIGIVGAFGYLLLYIIEAANDKVEDYNYTEYIESKERQDETKRGSTGSKRNQRD